MDDIQFFGLVVGYVFVYAAGVQSGRMTPSKHATFIERRKNQRNRSVWTAESRERILNYYIDAPSYIAREGGDPDWEDKE